MSLSWAGPAWLHHARNGWALAAAAGALLTLVSCNPATGDHWQDSEAYLVLSLHDEGGASLQGASVRIRVAEEPCPAATVATESVARTNASGQIAMQLEASPAGHDIDGCLYFDVTAPFGLRDTTFGNVSAHFRPATSAEPLDTVRVDIGLSPSS